MGNTHQTPLGFPFVQAPEVESTKADVLFDNPKDPFGPGGVGGPQALAFLAGEIDSGLACTLPSPISFIICKTFVPSPPPSCRAIGCAADLLMLRIICIVADMVWRMAG